jgi:FkbM family methyltransferase
MLRASSRLRALRDYQRNLGTGCGLRWYMLQSLETHGRLKAPVSVRPAKLRHKVLLRTGGSSDPDVFWQIFLKNEYAFIDSLTDDVRTVIDLGANIGLASALFLSRWPRASVLAVEPDPGNFDMLSANVAAYGARAQALKGAVWTRSGELELSRTFGDGREWARAVQERTGSGEGVQAFSMQELLSRVPGGCVDLLKIDIEGSEAALFSADTSWMQRVRNLAIELHGPECVAAFRAGMRRYCWQESTCGEYLVCRDLQLAN